MNILKVKFMQVEPTTRCNFKCGFCCGRHQIQGDMSPATFDHILQCFDDCKVLQLQGEGEPLLHPRFFDFAGQARNKGISVSIVTNGSQFSEKNIRLIFETGIERIDCSIDSADPQIYAALRGYELEKVIKGIDALSKVRTDLGLKKPAIGLSAIIMNQTTGSIMDLLALYKKLRLDGSINFQLLQKLDVYARYYQEEMKSQILSSEEFEALKDKYADNPELRSVYREQNPIREFFLRLFDGVDTASEGCPWLFKGLFVNMEGYTMPCSIVKDAGRFSFGRVGIADRETILQARNLMNCELLSGAIPESCQGCNIARSIVETNNMRRSDL